MPPPSKPRRSLTAPHTKVIITGGPSVAISNASSSPPIKASNQRYGTYDSKMKCSTSEVLNPEVGPVEDAWRSRQPASSFTESHRPH